MDRSVSVMANRRHFGPKGNCCTEVAMKQARDEVARQGNCRRAISQGPHRLVFRWHDSISISSRGRAVTATHVFLTTIEGRRMP